MELYYGRLSGDNRILLDEGESHHLLKVNRKKTGELVSVTDGEGRLFTARFTDLVKRNCLLEIEHTEISSPKKYRLHIAVAPTKSIDRMEWFLEKATEIGINEISFLVCRHSERKEIKVERLNRVLIAAMKQSLKTYLPVLNPILNYQEFVEAEREGIKIICSADAEEKSNFKKNYQPGETLTGLIGPEGDFQASEKELAQKNGYLATTLGESRLRTETAALTICTFFNFVNSQ